MKRGFLREKTVFQIIILIISIVYFSYAIKPAEAASDVCCEKTISEQYCFYGDSSNCDPAYQYASANCGQTSFCKTGCCHDFDEGQCYKSVPQAKCLSTEGGEWYSDETCKSVAPCKTGCCILGSECSLTTEQSCALETAKYPELDMVYQSNINTESSCHDICRAGEKGCCVNTDGSCAYETREACNAGDGNFYNNQYCSDVAICGCAEHNTKTCYDDDVYWQDSCGNLEEVGEDCDYAGGTLCKNIQGEYKCGSINCETTYSDEKNVHDTNIGGYRKNGESWCIYESPTGAGLDRPGSRHYRHMCINGEEVIESCRDMREEICTQGEQDGLIGSLCLHNDIYGSAVTQQMSSVPKGQRFWEQDTQSGTGSQSLCESAESDCPVVWVKKRTGASWHCKGNCQCEDTGYTQEMAEYCKSMGDCGADFNILGEFTHDSFSVTSTGKKGPPTSLSSDQIKSWNNYGVFGGMMGLYQEILDLIASILESGTEAEKDAEKAVADQKQLGLYSIMGVAIAGYMIGTAVATAAATAMATAAAAGVVATGASVSASTLIAGSVVCWVCIVVVVVVLIILYIFGMTGDSKTYHVKTACSPWVAPDGGSDCEKCLDQGKVEKLGFYDTCSEYKCKSLGKNCNYIQENAGTERVACYNSNPNDVNSPIIEPWQEALTEGFNMNIIASGYEITPEVPYYTKITFGIKTNELSQCKISKEHKDSYESMTSFFGGSYYQLEHEITINPQVGGQSHDYYVRCKDGSGNSNTAEYNIRFMVEDEPDMTAPAIEGTSIEDYAYIKSGLEETGLAAYINEPANCKWSLTDQKYDEMENNFICEEEPTNALGYDTYPCYALINITEGFDTYYFRCEDKSEFLNQNQQSYEFHLTSTDELTITSQGPEGTLYDTVSPTLTATTSGGAENGKATCYYSDDATRENYLWPKFYETDSSSHSQQLISLAQGQHNYYVLCEDIALNQANTTISFNIDKDTKAPEVDYIYMDSAVLHIILDEPSTCEYSNETFSYGEGSIMSGAGTTHNTVSTSESSYYINCEDIYNNHWSSPIIVYL